MNPPTTQTPTALAPPPPTWPPPQGMWTYQDYARLPANRFRYEVIGGNLYMAPAPNPKHQKVSVKLSAALEQFVTHRHLGEVYTAPIDVVLPELATPVQPDILFIAVENQDIIGDTRIQGTPDFIAEILSPGNPEHDRYLKFHLYAQAGVSEYWIIDPARCTVEVYVLRGQAYALLGSFTQAETLRSEIFPDLALPVSHLCTAS